MGTEEAAREHCNYISYTRLRTHERASRREIVYIRRHETSHDNYSRIWSKDISNSGIRFAASWPWFYTVERSLEETCDKTVAGDSLGGYIDDDSYARTSPPHDTCYLVVHTSVDSWARKDPFAAITVRR